MNTSEAVTVVTSATKQPKPVKAADSNRIPVRWMLFVTPLDFPGTQESNVTCRAEPLTHGRSYVCSYIKDLSSFELRSYVSGDADPAFERLIPLVQVKQYEWL